MIAVRHFLPHRQRDRCSDDDRQYDHQQQAELIRNGPAEVELQAGGREYQQTD
jgi:hypothetical protein